MKKLPVISMIFIMCIILMYKFIYTESTQPEVKSSTECKLTAGAGNIIKDYEQVNLSDSEEDTEPTSENNYNYLNQKYQYSLFNEDCGSEVYESEFTYYEIPEEYKKAGGEFPEEVQKYLWELCKQKNLNYYLVVALLESESNYRYDSVGDNGNSFGYMQIYRKYHYERMEKEDVEDLFDPYGNLRVATTFLQELYDSYGSRGDNGVLMMYNMGARGANKCWEKGIYSSKYSREIIRRSQEIEQELKQD